MVEALLKAGADPKTLTTEDGETVLMTAARAGNADVVRMLLDRGADVNAREKYKGQTALMWAAAERHPAVVKLLLDRGADWKVRSFDRETKVPRLSAASSISPIARGGFTALSFAAREGDIESARVMLDGGVDINYGDVDNTSALVVAIMNKQYSFAKFLIDRGADVERRRWIRAHGVCTPSSISATRIGPRFPNAKDRGSSSDSGHRQGTARPRRERERSRSRPIFPAEAAWIPAIRLCTPARRR